VIKKMSEVEKEADKGRKEIQHNQSPYLNKHLSRSTSSGDAADHPSICSLQSILCQ
jgi:hypothetical protein